MMLWVAVGFNLYEDCPLSGSYENDMEVEREIRSLLVDFSHAVRCDGLVEINILIYPTEQSIGTSSTNCSAKDVSGCYLVSFVAYWCSTTQGKAVNKAGLICSLDPVQHAGCFKIVIDTATEGHIVDNSLDGGEGLDGLGKCWRG
jgi:hypothetical protein